MQNQPSPDSKEIISRFEKLLAGLARSGVDFAVAGGLAVILNGYPRLTFDVDILIDDQPANVEKLLQYLRTWGEGWARELSLSDFQPQEGAIRISEDFDLDVFTRMRGHSLSDFRDRARSFTVSDVLIPYLAPQDLIELKKESWREKDQMDVAALRVLLQEGKTGA